MLNVDSNKAFGFSIYTPVAASKLSVSLLDPAGKPVNLFLHAQKVGSAPQAPHSLYFSLAHAPPPLPRLPCP